MDFLKFEIFERVSKIANKLENLDDKFLIKNKINSGGELMNNKTMFNKWKDYWVGIFQKFPEYVEAIKKDVFVIHDKLEDDNYHNLNMFLAVNDYYDEGFKKSYMSVLDSPYYKNVDFIVK